MMKVRNAQSDGEGPKVNLKELEKKARGQKGLKRKRN
jgi:hypothetical protein